MTDVLYTSDLIRGMDVLRVHAADEDPEERASVEAPILETWLDGTADDLVGDPAGALPGSGG